MKTIIFCYFFINFFFVFMLNIHSQSLPIRTHTLNDQCNNIRNYLERVACELTENSLAGINTLADWQALRPQRYHEFIDMMSLVDVPLTSERPPLNVKKVGTIQKNGYRIEKLYYESLPGLYVPANLYIPTKIDKPVPAILYVCGHARTQKVHYQAHPRKFAQLGFVCLIIETIQWGEVEGEHWGSYARGWFHWYSRGYTPGGVELWNAIRGLDLLCDRAEVDNNKLGVTGISGGGAQTWYIAAADPRIKAAAPVCGTSTVKAHVFQRTIDGHCDCMMPINTYLRDFHDIGALIAPRPLLIASADRDGLNTIESVRECYYRIKNVYDLYGQSDNVTLVETPGGHSYHNSSRTKIFSFFLKHLFDRDLPAARIGDIDESETVQLSADELKVYVDAAPEDDRTKTIQDSFIKIPLAPQITVASELDSYRAQVIDFLKEQTFRAFPAEPVSLQPCWEFRTEDGATNGRSVFSFVSEKDWRLKVDIRWKNPEEKNAPIMLVLRSPGENRWDSESFVHDLDNRFNVAYFEVRGVGETSWGPELQWHIRRAAAWTGRTIASMRVYDVFRCLQFLRTLNGIGEIALAARDEMGVVAIYAALLDGNILAVLLQNPPESQNVASRPDGRGEAIEMLNCLRVSDVPQVAGLLFPKEIGIVGQLPGAFAWTEALYRQLGRPGAFQVVAEVSEWKSPCP